MTETKTANAIDLALATFPNTKPSDWRLVGEAAAYKTVPDPHEKCIFDGPAILRYGQFLGGRFRGGIFRSGTYYGGAFLGGEFNGGTYYGGTYYGGTFNRGSYNGGEYHGGVFHAGVFNDGLFTGGEFLRGAFSGGTFHGGAYRDTPHVVTGVLPATATRQGAGDDRIAIGDECLSVTEWETRASEMADSDPEAAGRLLRVIRVLSY